VKHVRRWLPWLIAAAILAVMAARLDTADLARAFATGPSFQVALCSTAVVVAALAADSWATLQAFAATGVRCPWGGLLEARGASYLLGLLGGAVGQGGMGIYLHRAGAGAVRALGTVGFLLATQLTALAAVAACGAAAELADPAGASSLVRRSLPLLALLAAGFALYALVLVWRPAWLTRHALLAPAFGAGLGGFLRSTAARLPHVLVMILGLWLGLRLWGVPMPLAHGLVVIAITVLITVVPLVPSGIGTLELAVVELVAPYAPAAAAAAQRASVLAFTLVYHLFSILTQGAIGLLCLGLLGRRSEALRCEIAPLPADGRAARATRPAG
jgi:uncharacterized membrane protein YbhN (UPF0104 family)